jgi:hypothetical protein
LASAQVAFRKDEEDDELEMQMALDQLQSFIDLEPAPKRRAGGSISRNSPNIERARIAMDNQMYLDYFADPPIWVPSFFRRRYRMRRSYDFRESVCTGCLLRATEGCLWFDRLEFPTENHGCPSHALARCVR